MSTRSTIALEYAGNVIKKIYCHYDGYIEHTGLVLATKYTKREEVQKLIDGGDLRGVEINGEPQYFKNEEPMFPNVYTYKSYVESIDQVFHEYNYLFRLNGKWEVIEGHYKKGVTSPKSLNRCVGRLKAKQLAETKNSITNVIDENATV